MPYWGWGSIPDQYGAGGYRRRGEPGTEETGLATPDAAAPTARTGAGARVRPVRAPDSRDQLELWTRPVEAEPAPKTCARPAGAW